MRPSACILKLKIREKTYAIVMHFFNLVVKDDNSKTEKDVKIPT